MAKAQKCPFPAESIGNLQEGMKAFHRIVIGLGHRAARADGVESNTHPQRPGRNSIRFPGAEKRIQLIFAGYWFLLWPQLCPPFDDQCF